METRADLVLAVLRPDFLLNRENHATFSQMMGGRSDGSSRTAQGFTQRCHMVWRSFLSNDASQEIKPAPPPVRKRRLSLIAKMFLMWRRFREGRTHHALSVGLPFSWAGLAQTQQKTVAFDKAFAWAWFVSSQWEAVLDSVVRWACRNISKLISWFPLDLLPLIASLWPLTL